MKLKTKKIIFYSLVASTVAFTGAGLGCLFGWAQVDKVDFKTITSNEVDYNSNHTGLVTGSILTGFAAASLLVLVEFGLSYFFALKFINNRKEKMKKEAQYNSTMLNKKTDPLVIKNATKPSTNLDNKKR